MSVATPKEPGLEAQLAGVEPRPDLEKLFALHQKGYLGADGVMSIPLPDGRVFWLFGDTVIGELVDGQRVMEKMPRNTAAIQDGRPEDPASIRWLFRPERDGLAPFVSITDDDEERWFWGGTGIVLEGEMFVLGYGIASEKGEVESLSFRLAEPRMARVRDTSGDPMKWKIETEIMTGAPTAPWFCSGCYRQGDHLYVIGFDSGDDPLGLHKSRAVMGRYRVADLLKFGGTSQLEVWAGDAIGWSTDFASASTLFAPGITESSILWNPAGGNFLTTCYDALNARFYVVTAPALTGPWSTPRPAFRLPGHGKHDGTLAYTLRLHPHLPAPAGMVVASYVVNTTSLETVLARPSVYYPRFVNLPLSGGAA